MPRSTKRQIPGQLPMFMTPRDIVSQYQPLEGDREDSPRAGSWTGRSHTTAGESNRRNDHPMAVARSEHFVRPERMESDSDLWARKTMEAHLDPEEYHEMRGSSESRPSKAPDLDFEALYDRTSYPAYQGSEPTSSWEEREGSYLNRKAEEHEAAHEARFSGPSLYESVQQQGVQKPVHLGTQFHPKSGKPEVIGGHHRIASALETRPDDLIPVLHTTDILKARSDKAYPYS